MGKNLLLLSGSKKSAFSLSQCFENIAPDFVINGSETAKPLKTHKTSTMEQTFTWTYNIIKSCNNDFHFDCADVLISLFKVKYGDSDMVLQLKQLRENKWVSIHGILV
jgi:hypothetical protein